MSAKTLAQREKLVTEVEELMLRGIHRPTSIARMVEGIGATTTAKRYIEVIRRRWRERGAIDNESHRQRLLAEAQEIYRRAFVAVAVASNLESSAATLGAIGTNLGVALKSLERQSKLLGLDSEKRVVENSDEKLGALRDAILAIPVAQPSGVSPVVEMYADVHFDIRGASSALDHS